jgi:hypothetical protein
MVELHDGDPAPEQAPMSCPGGTMTARESPPSAGCDVRLPRLTGLAIVAGLALLPGCSTPSNAVSAAGPPQAADAKTAAMPPYVGQPVPGLIPERFAPGIVNTAAIELNGVFSPDQREFYFTRVVDGVDTMHRIVFTGGKWSGPQPLQLFPGNARVEAADMVFTRDGQELFFLAKLPPAPGVEKPSYDIWRSRRARGDWSPAELVPAPVSSPSDDYYPVFGPDGSLYLNTDRGGRDIYRFERRADGTFAPAVKAGHPFQPRDGDLTFAPDGSFIVVSAQRPRAGGSYRNDLHVSFRRPDGTWADFVRLDDSINTAHHEWCPMVTPDGKYLFFSRRLGKFDTQGWEGTTDGEVYWVDVRALDKYRS